MIKLITIAIITASIIAYVIYEFSNGIFLSPIIAYMHLFYLNIFDSVVNYTSLPLSFPQHPSLHHFHTAAAAPVFAHDYLPVDLFPKLRNVRDYSDQAVSFRKPVERAHRLLQRFLIQ